MEMQPFYVYTDGSFSRATNVGVAGFMIFDNADDHTMQQTSLAKIRTVLMKEENNIRVELRSALAALDEVRQSGIAPGGQRRRDEEIHLFTDCNALVNLPTRREALEASQYRSKRGGGFLKNADLYREFFEIYDDMHPIIYWTKGHSPRTKRDFVQENFSFLDKLVRRQLRREMKRINGYV